MRARSGSRSALSSVSKGSQCAAISAGKDLAGAAPGGFGYSPGTPSSRASAASDNAFLRKVEEGMGIKIRPEYREQAAARIDALMGGGR